MIMDYKKVEPKKIDDIHWEIPIGTIPNMNVPGLVIASEKQIAKMQQDRTLIQCAGVATLPGIYKHAITLPDGHEGYGFPIGGVAALDYKEGGISPGGIGYDINCTHPEIKTFLEHGTWLKIKDLEDKWNKTNVKFSDLKNFDLNDTNLNFFMKREENGFLYEITSKTGHNIKVTADHPIFTKEGMKKVKHLNLDDTIIIHSFEGVEYKEPTDEIILTKESFEKVLDKIGVTSKGNAKRQVLNFINNLGIFPLKYDSKETPYLLKLIGFILGDGALSVSSIKQANFYANLEDLTEIKRDIEKLGFDTQNIFQRERKHKIRTNYGDREFYFKETSLHKKSVAFAALLIALGCPYGSKTHQEYRVPKWILKAQLWQKRLFLASFFGAELSTPKTLNKYNFYELQLNMSKYEPLKENAIDFLNDIRLMLLEFGIESHFPVEVRGYTYDGQKGKTVGLRLQILANPKNLLNFFEKIGYEYNKKKYRKACLAANYIRLKERVVKEREVIRLKAQEKYGQQVPVSEIVNELESRYATKQFIKHSVWSDYKGVRIAFDFMSFDKYCEDYSAGENGLAWSEIKEIKKIPYNGFVYDFNINDPNHNFIANNFIVSNCGVRLVRTNLQKEEMTKHLPALLDAVFRNVPSGVGSKGKVKVNTQADFDEVLKLGSRWAVEKEFGWKEDLKHLEEEGCLEQADPSKVSDDAKKRGMPQVGSLGAGNHFLEVQYVDKIYMPDVAKKFGIEHEGQVMFMIHTGSRGCGHQICSDYLRLMEKEYHSLIAKLPDRELVYAPSGSKMAEDYFAAMCAGANYAWANRQMILHWIRQSFEDTFKKEAETMGLNVVYDVCHNIAKVEEHDINGVKKKVYVHRKGATRAFGPGRKEIPADYRSVGQPVIIPGSMGTASYVLVGTEQAMKESFGSTAHGAGREMSRNEALRRYTGDSVRHELEKRNILIRAATKSVIAEEAPGAYKDIDEVARVSDQAGIGKIVARLVPMGVAKG